MTTNANLKRDQYLQQRYSITSAQYQKLWDLQKGVCPICLKPLYKPGNKQGKRASAVDHDHSTKRVRGILCYRDNRFTIGRNRDTKKLKRVIQYLESSFDGRDL